MLSTARPPSEHRTQAERSADTRDKVINAAIACIAEDGFKQTTTTRIARRAGVTWGAIQHQFGDKDSILRAVMERGMEEFRAELVGVDVRTSTLEERVGEHAAGLDVFSATGISGVSRHRAQHAELQ